MDLALHPLCALFPPIEGAEFEGLKADIEANGLQRPIVMLDGTILDGANRYRACIESGVEPITVPYSGNDPLQFVLSENLHRRHLTAGQHAAIVASATDWLEAQTHGGDRKSDQAATLPLETVAARAAQSGASERTQRMADKVARANPELAKQVAYGEISLPKAVEQVSGEKPLRAKVKGPEGSSLPPDRQETPSATPEYIGPSESELAAALDQERADREKYDALVEVAYADDKLAAALKLVDDQAAEISRLRAEISVLRERQTGLMNEKVQLESQAKRWMAIAKKLGWTPGAAK